jgi:ABC-type phosphate/phosphonate transport system substrate-binding protein
MRNRKSSLGVLAIATLAILASLPFRVGAQDTRPMQIGMAKSFFNDVSETIINIVVEPFGDLMKQTTSLDGRLNPNYSAFEVADKLDKNEMQFGVFHGHELAWIMKKYPTLQPITVAVNKYRDVRAFLIVHKDSPVKTRADLAGKIIAVPLGSKEHCRVYLDRYCTDNAQCDPKKFYGTIVKSTTPEAALDDILRGKVQAALVDTISLEFYKDIKEPHFGKLRILQESEPFPEAVIVCKQGVHDDVTLKKFQNGLANAHDTALGRDMMKMWKIAAFEPVPENYMQQLQETLKNYPLPTK